MSSLVSILALVPTSIFYRNDLLLDNGTVEIARLFFSSALMSFFEGEGGPSFSRSPRRCRNVESTGFMLMGREKT